jgi:hypothetical protein
MTHRLMRKLSAVSMAAAIAIAAEPRTDGAGPGEAGGGQRPARASGLAPPGTDYVVLVWYLRDKPLDTFQSQTYDVRKGEYTPAVDAWVELMRSKHPRYLVRVHAVDLDRERGATEQLKVGSVIHRELLMAAAQSGVILDAPLRIGPGPFTGPSQSPSVNRMPARPQTDRSFLNSSPTPSIPVYPRTRAP